MCEQLLLAKICGVCGDKAKVRNFGAIVCESCKCFFRRAALKTHTMECIFNGKCDINKRNRRSCRKCRLDKCYAIGMRKELVMGKIKKLELEGSLSSDSCLSDDCSDINLFEDFNGILDSFSGQTSEPLMRFGYCVHSPDSCLSSESEPEVVTNNEVIPIAKPIATFDKHLNDMEVSKLCELQSASSHFGHFGDFACYSETKYCSHLDNLDDLYKFISSMNMFDRHIKSAVSFAKTFDKFKDMPENEQISLVKNNCWKLVVLKNSFAFDFERGHWTFAIDNDHSVRYNVDIFRKLNEDAYQNCMQFWRLFDPDWRRDRTLIQLFMAIVMFDVDSYELVHKSFVKFIQQMYLYLLQRYLRQKFGSEEQSSQYFSTIMNCLSKFYKIPKVQKSVVQDYGKYFSQLVIETFSD